MVWQDGKKAVIFLSPVFMQLLGGLAYRAIGLSYFTRRASLWALQFLIKLNIDLFSLGGLFFITVHVIFSTELFFCFKNYSFINTWLWKFKSKNSQEYWKGMDRLTACCGFTCSQTHRWLTKLRQGKSRPWRRFGYPVSISLDFDDFTSPFTPWFLFRLRR